MIKIEATDESRAVALEMLVWGTTVEEFSNRHNLNFEEVRDFISRAQPLTRTIGIALASRLGYPPYYFEDTVPRIRHDEVLVRTHYKATDLKRITVLKELISSQSETKISKNIQTIWIAIEKYLSGALKLDKINGRKLALKLGLPMNYFDVTQPAGDYLPPIPHATILENRHKILKSKPEAPRNFKELKIAVKKFHYKASGADRILVLKELIDDKTIEQFAEEHDINENNLNKILTGAVEFDRLLAGKLALRLRLAQDYFEVTPPKS